MRKAKYLLPIAALSLAFLVSCGGADKSKQESAKGENGSQAAEASEASAGGELNVQVGSSPETMDPALNSASDGATYILHAFTGLLSIDKNSDVVPGLAEKWEHSDDGLTWTFHLRPDLKWSDGTDLTAEDFVYSWKRLADPALAAPYGYDLLSVVAGYEEASNGDLDALQVSAPDKDTFVVKLSSPCTFFDQIAAFVSTAPVQKKTVEENGDAWATKPETYVSSGPYRMTEYVDGDRIVYEKNPYYYDKDNITFDKIVWHLIEDGNSVYTAYNQGELDLAKTLPSEEIPSLKGNEEFHLEPMMGTYYISFNTQKAPFNDPKVREALSLAVDRDYVANTIMQGTYTPANNLVGPGISDAAENSSFEEVTKEKYGNFFDNSKYEENLAKAKELLAEAGYPNGQGFPAFSYLTNDASYHKPVAEYLQNAWGQLGLTMNIDIQEWKTVTANRRSGNYDVARNGWVMDYNDPSNMINLFETGNGNNDGKYSDPDFDALVDKARKTANVEEHYDYLHQAEQVLLKDYGACPVAYYTEFYLEKPNLSNVWHTPTGYFLFMYGKKA